MSRKLVEYRTVMVEHIVDLDRKVKDFARQGFELHGSPFSYNDGCHYSKDVVVQAMVKYEDSGSLGDKIETER